MKTECDKNGLEYELLMQEATKERFLRQIRPNMMPFEKLSKNLVIIKKKREDSTVKAAPLEEPQSTGDPHLAVPHLSAVNNQVLPKLPHFDLPNFQLDNLNFDNLNLDNLNLGNIRNLHLDNLDFGNLNLGAAPQPFAFPDNFEPGRLLMSFRATTTPKPTDPPAHTLPTLPTLAPISFRPITWPSNMPNLVIQPSHTL